MDSYKIEQLISESVSNRPKATSAPLNLYIHKNRLICGARAVMPIEATFVCHIAEPDLKNGFSEKLWKSIIQEIQQIIGNGKLTSPGNFSSLQNCSSPHSQPDTPSVAERRREKRLPFRRPIWFGQKLKQPVLQGRMRDISSGGMAFSCGNNGETLKTGQQINTRFIVPRFNHDNSYSTISFDRTANIRWIDKVEHNLFRIAVQFEKSLPFKPAEQALELSSK